MTVMFNMQKLTGHGSVWPEYRWWPEFIERFCIEGQKFEIRCWNVDLEGIESATRFGNEVLNEETEERVFQGTISKNMLNELYIDYLSKRGQLKWFSVFMYLPEGEIFSCEHYGTELYFTNCDRRTADDVRLWAMKFECFRKASII